MTEPDESSVETPTEYPFWWIAVLRRAPAAGRRGRRPTAHQRRRSMVPLHGRELAQWRWCLYRDAVDTNPPLIVDLMVPPAWAARVLGADAIPMSGIRVRARRDLCPGLRTLHHAAMGATRSPMDALLVTTLVFLVLPFPKEILVSANISPYWERCRRVLARRRVERSTGRSRRSRPCWTGIVGALGFALKPHFLLAWIAVEGGLAFQARQLGTLRHWQPLAARRHTGCARAGRRCCSFPSIWRSPTACAGWYGDESSGDPGCRNARAAARRSAPAISALALLAATHWPAQLVVGTAAGGLAGVAVANEGVGLPQAGPPGVPRSFFRRPVFRTSLPPRRQSPNSMRRRPRCGCRGGAVPDRNERKICD